MQSKIEWNIAFAWNYDYYISFIIKVSEKESKDKREKEKRMQEGGREQEK